MAEAVVVSGHKPSVWVVGFFFFNPNLIMELRTDISGIS